MRINDKASFDKENVFGLGNPNDAYAQFFIGQSYLNPLTNPGECPVFLANVTFEPGCRNNWHIHKAKSGGGQLLICTAGEGWYGNNSLRRGKTDKKDAVKLANYGLDHWLTLPRYVPEEDTRLMLKTCYRQYQ